MLTIRHIVAMGLMLLLPFAAQGGNMSERYREAASVFHQLQKNRSGNPGDWRALAAVFGNLEREHPAHDRAAAALYSAALSLQQAYAVSGARSDLKRAMESFKRFAASYPRHRLADDSLMQLANLHRRELRHSAAAGLYRKLINTYPSGDQVSLARKQLAALEKSSASAPKAKKYPRANTAAQGHGAGAQGHSAGAQRHSAGTLTRVQSWSALSATRIILTTDRQSVYRYGMIPRKGKQPARLYIDLKEVQPAKYLELVQPVDDLVLKRIRIAQRPGSVTRVVLDLNRIKSYTIKDFALPAERKIVIDLQPTAIALADNSSGRQHARGYNSQRTGRLTRTQQSTRPADADKVAIETVVIDAGHGGHDPGAIGFGMQEKTLALDIARRLRKVLLRNRPDLKVGLTRDSDVFIPLDERPRIAKQMGADLFVSIHLNANPFERIQGIETYFLNLTADASAIKVAARENSLSESKIGDLNTILADLLQDTNILESDRLARTLQASLVGRLITGFPVRNLGVKQAPFLVLIGSEMPSVLVEAGFITNRAESGRLKNAGYRSKIAEGIYEGLLDYINGDTLAQKKPPVPVKIAKIDS